MDVKLSTDTTCSRCGLRPKPIRRIDQPFPYADIVPVPPRRREMNSHPSFTMWRAYYWTAMQRLRASRTCYAYSNKSARPENHSYICLLSCYVRETSQEKSLQVAGVELPNLQRLTIHLDAHLLWVCQDPDILSLVRSRWTARTLQFIEINYLRRSAASRAPECPCG